MAETLYSFDQSGMQRAVNAIRRVEAGSDVGPENAAKFSHAPVQLIEITGAAEVGTGHYPGKVVTYTGTGGVATQNNLGNVRVHNTVATVKFKTGNLILCRFTGPTEDGNYGLFVPAYPVKVVEVVTDVQCVDGEISVDYTDVIVLDLEVA